MPTTSHSLARTAWLTVVLLMPVAMLNYLDRQMLASMQTSVMRDLPSIGDQARWGFMLGQFKWVYACASPLGGWLADRYSRKWTVCLSLFVWSTVTWATSSVQDYSELLWTRSLMGFSEAFYIPAALALISEYHGSGTRSRAVGLHQFAIYCGVILGGFGGYVADDANLGWRFAFQMCGVCGMLYAVPLMLFLRDAPRVAKLERPSSALWGNLTTLLRNRAFLYLVLYFTLPAMAAWIVRDWMPGILKDQFNLGQGRAGVTATIYWQVAAIVGVIVGGWLADRWQTRNPRGRIFVSAIGVSLIAPAILGVGFATHLSLAIGFLIVFGIGWGFFDCNNMPILCQIVRPEQRATGYGLMNFVSIGCGGFADWSFGVLRDQQVPLKIVLGLFAVSALVSVVPVLLIARRITSSTTDHENPR